jgi:hypothetical protein
LLLFCFLRLSYSADNVEETITYGCAGCKNNQAIWDELNRAEMERAAAAAEAQRGLAMQREAEAKAAAQSAEKARQRQECGQKRGSISGSLSGCKSAASSTKSRTYNNCPVEAEISTGINAGLGNISVITTPRKTCIENADAAYIAAVDSCESTAANALAALPSYCY